jgi:hypothetical protein
VRSRLHTAPVPTGLCRAMTFSAAFWQRAWYHAPTSRPQIWRPSSISSVPWQWRGCFCCDNRTVTTVRKLVGLWAATQAGRPGTRLRPTACRGYLRDHRAFRPSGSAGRYDRGIDRPGDHVPRLGIGGTGCPRADRDGHPYRHGVYAFGLILLSTLSFVGFMTFQRVLQSGIEDHGYAERIARLRAYYFDCAPELVPYLASVPPPQRLVIHGLRTQLLAGLPDRRRNGWRRYSGPGRLRGWPAHRHRRWSFRGRRVRRRRDRGRRHPGGADGVPVPPISFSLRRRAKRARHRLAAAIMGPGSGFVSTHGSPSAGLLLLWACSREVCCPATPSRAWLSSRSRGNTVRRQRVMARTVTCCLL